MSAIALVGSVTLALKDSTLEKITLPLVAFAAGSLIGSAFFLMIPSSIALMENPVATFYWVVAGFIAFNALSAMTFLVGGIIAYALPFNLNIAFLVPLAAGNFIYIGATDLVPEVNKHKDWRKNLLHFAAYLCGILVILLTRIVSKPGVH